MLEKHLMLSGESNVIPAQDSLIIHRLFDCPPSILSIERIPSGEILEVASRIYGKGFDPKKVHDAAVVKMIVTFWWGGAKYVQASGEEERKNLAKYVAVRRSKLETLTI